jgi:glutamate-1-semialdehyde 2,1-aminomutase
MSLHQGMKISQSQEIFRQAEEVMVGGVNSPVRSFRSVGGNPIIMKEAKGSQLYDQDGNAYTDYCLSWGALIYGHAHRNVILAAKRTVEKGVSFGTSTRAELDLAKLVVKSVPSIEMIRFVNSGTEATMSAIRLARGYTGRPMLLKFDGCYHGHYDDLLTTAGSGVAALPGSSSLGVPAGHITNTLSLPYNNIEILTETIAKYKDQIACVILEPVAGNMGVIPATLEFLKILRELTRKHSIILIFDEIMTGFRSSMGGVQTEYGIIPDLTCLGKIIGGGFPVGAYGGCKEMMKHLAPLGGVYQAGTFSGNPVVMRAGWATLRLLSKEFYASLNKRCETFSQSVNNLFKDHNLPVHLSHYRGMMSLRFSKNPVTNYAEARAASNDAIYSQLFQFLLTKGIYLPPADLEAFFICGMHTPKDLRHLANAFKEFFCRH